MTEETKEREYLKTFLTKVDLKLAEVDEAIHIKKDKIEYINKQMLYVACKRLMHKLDLTYTGKITDLIE